MEFRKQNGIIKPLTVNDKQGWNGTITLKSGEIIDLKNVSYLNIYNLFVGLAIEYGMRNDLNYDQVVLSERFGGGNGVGCFFQRHRKIYVGLTCEKRNGGQEVWELPRFFCGTTNEGRMESFQQNLEKDHFDFADVNPMDKPVNCNSAYNYTASEDEGLQIFFVETDFNCKKFLYSKKDDSYVFFNLEMIERDKSTKRIVESRFFNIDTLCANQDVFASAFVGKFWTHVRTGKIKLQK